MNFHDQLKNALDYIEDNLDGDIDLRIAAQKAFCSSYHFQRMFSYLIGIPLAEYIRCRRMTLAAFELQNSDIRVVDVAVRYGYDSQSSFTRAFQNFHGITPSAARIAGAAVKAYPKVSFQITVKGTEEMNYRIEKTEPFSLFGFSIPLTPVDTRMNNIFDRLGLYADEVMENGSHAATNFAAGQPEGTLLTAVRFGFQSDGSCQFMFAADMPEQGIGENTDGFTVLEISSAVWAVFKYKLVYYPETHEPLYRKIYEEWFPTSDYEQAEGPCLERFSQDNMEAWIPIRRRRK